MNYIPIFGHNTIIVGRLRDLRHLQAAQALVVAMTRTIIRLSSLISIPSSPSLAYCHHFLYSPSFHLVIAPT